MKQLFAFLFFVPAVVFGQSEVTVGTNPFLTTRGQLQVFGPTNSFPNGSIAVYRSGVTANAAGLTLGSVAGAYASPYGMLSGYNLGIVQFLGSTGDLTGTAPTMFEGARLSVKTVGDWSGTSRGSAFVMSVIGQGYNSRRDVYTFGEGFNYIGRDPFVISLPGGQRTGTTERLQIEGDGYFLGKVKTSGLNIRVNFTPTSGADTSGEVGDIAVDSNNIYFKTTSGWKYAPLLPVQ